MAQVTSNLNTSATTATASNYTLPTISTSNQTMSNSTSTVMFHTNTFNELQVAKLIEGTANTTVVFQVRTTNGRVNVKGGTNYKEMPYGLVIGNFVRAASPIQVSVNLSGNSQEQIDRINQMVQYDQDNFSLELMQQEYIAHPGQVVKIGLSVEDIQQINDYLTNSNTGSAYIEVTTSTAGLLLIGDSTYTPDGETLVKQEMAVVSLAFPVATLTEEFIVSGGAVTDSRFAHISDVTNLSARIEPIQSGNKLQTAYGQLVTNAMSHNEMLAKLYSTGSSQAIKGLSGIVNVKPIENSLMHIFDNSNFTGFSTSVFRTEDNDTIPTFELTEEVETVEV